MTKDYKFVYRFKYTNDNETRKYQVYATKPLPRGFDAQTLVDWPHPLFEYNESEHTQGIIRISEFFNNLKKLPGCADIEFSRTTHVPKDRLKMGYPAPIELSTYYPDQVKGKSHQKELKYVYKFKYVDRGQTKKYQVYATKPLPHTVDVQSFVSWGAFFSNIKDKLSGYEDFEFSRTPNVPKDQLKIGYPETIDLSLVSIDQKEFKYVYRFTCTNFVSQQRLQVYGNKPLPHDLHPEYLLGGWQDISVETGVKRFCENLRQNLPGFEDFELREIPNVPKDKLKKGFYYPIELILSLL